MPVFYSYDEKNNLVHSFAMCDCGSSDLIENMRHIAQSDDINHGFVEVVDMEQMDELDISPEELESLKDAFFECHNKGCKRIVFHQPNTNRKDLKVLRLLKNMVKGALSGKDDVVVFTRNRKELEKSVGI